MANDWLPSSQAARLEMAIKWSEVITPQKATEWGIPSTEMSNLNNGISMVQNAERQFLASGSPGDRARLKEAFTFLVYNMRRMKRQRFTVPPLVDSDFIDLGLRPPDVVKTTIHPPTVGATGIIAYPGTNRIEVRDMRPDEDVIVDTRAKWGFRIHFGIFDEKAAIIDEKDKTKVIIDATQLAAEYRIFKRPEVPEELPHSVFTRRRRYLFNFSGATGMKIFVAICYENSKGQRGPFGPIIEAVVP